MARWRLREKHYLSVPGTEWEYVEVDQTTGRPVRKRYIVPRLLDPNEPSDWTMMHYVNGKPISGEVIVAYEGSAVDRDIVFEGEPTPDMEPLDAEAKAISASLARKWVHPIDSLPGNFSESIITDLQRQMDDIQREQVQPSRSLASVSQDDFKALQEQVTKLMEQNAQLTNQLADKPARRV